MKFVDVNNKSSIFFKEKINLNNTYRFKTMRYNSYIKKKKVKTIQWLKFDYLKEP